MVRLSNGTGSKVVAGLISTFMLIGLASAQTTTPAAPFQHRAPRQVLVSIPDRKLAIVEDGRVIRTFAVSVGAAVSPSPTGEFRIANRITNPTYYHPGVVIPAGNENPIGPRWVGLDRRGYGIHGTNQPSSIGRASSHGCIRLRNRDVKQFFEMVRVGDVVEIRAERDDQTAQIFEGAAHIGTALAQERALVASSDDEGQ